MHSSQVLFFLKIDSPRILNEDPIWWSAHSTTPPPKMWCFLHNFVLPNWLEQSKLSELHKSYPGPSKGYGTQWCLKVSINHPLGFNWHPLEGAGLWAFKLTRYADNDYIYINVSRTTYSNENLKLEFRIIIHSLDFHQDCNRCCCRFPMYEGTMKLRQSLGFLGGIQVSALKIWSFLCQSTPFVWFMGTVNLSQ